MILVILFVIIFTILQSSCVSDVEDHNREISRFSKTIPGLESGTVYYWRIRANTGNSEFKTATFIRSFLTI